MPGLGRRSAFTPPDPIPWTSRGRKHPSIGQMGTRVSRGGPFEAPGRLMRDSEGIFCLEG